MECRRFSNVSSDDHTTKRISSRADRLLRAIVGQFRAAATLTHLPSVRFDAADLFAKFLKFRRGKGCLKKGTRIMRGRGGMALPQHCYSASGTRCTLAPFLHL